MSDRKGKQPVSSHRPSQLRNEIIPDSSDNERGINESVVQVPNSDTAVPETQYIPEGLEHDRRDIWRQSSEPPNTADEALLSRCGYSKKTGTTVASPFVVRQLEKPKEVQGSIFSFASPNAFSKPALQMPLMPRPREDATVAPKPSPSIVQSTTPQNVDGHQADENSPVMHETYDHESVQPKSHNYGGDTEATSNSQDSHCPASYIQDFAQSEASAAHAIPPHSDAQTNVFDVHPGSEHLSQSRQVHDSMLHEKLGQDSSNRISKMRTKKRTKGPTTPPDLRNLNHGTTLSTSPEHEVILNMMAMCLRAGDTKARNILDINAKAHEDTVTSLRETIGQQNNLIQNLQARNDSLEGRVQKVSDTTTRLQKYVKGMEGDYARLKIQAEAHRKTCDNLMRVSIDEAEQEKLALQRDFLQTVDALNTSQRHMRAAMNDCFNQLMSTEGRYHVISKQMQKLTADYNEEKKKSSNLEQKILPAVQAITASLDENRAVILEKVGDVQGSLDDKSAEQEGDIRLKECLDALRSIQAIPMLTISDVRKAEVMLRFIHEK
ncbi:hypothetical protein SLS60_002318 [Paraconiothyrium brasiliense]|uniref:Uncharacterized protein n=1 Tax=Paraconiothyrium brasiliense TaxID=300254 RepID=A0ABR3S2G8_9PLEO